MARFRKSICSVESNHFLQESGLLCWRRERRQLFSRRRRRHVRDDVESRAARAEALVQMGELSAARQALEGATVAPGEEATRAALQDPAKRPPVLCDPIPADVMNAMPATPLVVDPESIARNLRSARRGAAAGPSGMTVDHLRVVWSQSTCWSCCEWAVSRPCRNQEAASGVSYVVTSCAGWLLAQLPR